MKHSVWKPVLSLALALFLFLGGLAPATVLAYPVAAGTKSLTYPDKYDTLAPYTAQQQSNWCWVACSVSIIKARKGVTVSQRTYCVDCLGSASNEGQTLAQIRGHLYTLRNINSTLTSGTVSNTVIMGQVVGNKPLLLSMLPSSGSGHAVLITGYDDTEPDIQFRIMDPDTKVGKFTIKTRDQVVDGYRNRFFWSATLYKFT